MPRYFTRKRSRTGAVSLWWQPSAPLRLEGFRSIQLADDVVRAYRRCDELNDRLDRWRRGELEVRPKPKHPRGSFAWLCDQYRVSREFQGCRPATQADYEKQIRALVDFFGEEPVRGVTRRAVYAYRQTLKPGRQALYRLQVLRLVLEHGRRLGEVVGDNPASRIGGFKLRARTAMWTDEQTTAFKAKAVELGCFSLALALDLALFTGQRQGDLLRLRWSDLRDGWFELEQGKTGAAVSIPLHSRLKAALGSAPRLGLCVLISESTQAPWQAHAFRKAWKRVSVAAGVEGVLFIDLRRTAVTALADAGCTVPQVAAITGHSIQDAQRILDTYLRPTRKQAAAAIRKLERHTR